MKLFDIKRILRATRSFMQIYYIVSMLVHCISCAIYDRLNNYKIIVLIIWSKTFERRENSDVTSSKCERRLGSLDRWMSKSVKRLFLLILNVVYDLMQGWKILKVIKNLRRHPFPVKIDRCRLYVTYNSSIIVAPLYMSYMCVYYVIIHITRAHAPNRDLASTIKTLRKF